MELGLSSQSKKSVSSSADKLSYLPKEIISSILSFLPVREAGRTSVLARKWRNMWASMPVLNLDVDSFSESKTDETQEFFYDWNMIIHNFVSLHEGPILGFRLQEPICFWPWDLDQWVDLITKKGLQVFSIKRLRSHINLYTLHSSLFMCSSLVTLELVDCKLEPPPGFQGFLSLKFLSLEKSSVSDLVLEYLVSNSKMLENLKLIDCIDLCCIMVHGLSLLSFYLKGEFLAIDLSGSLNLKRVTIHWSCIGDPRDCVLSQVIEGLTKLDFLGFSGWTTSDIFDGALDTKMQRLSAPYNSLNVLDIELIWFAREDFMGIVYFLKNSPYLEVLRIKIDVAIEAEGSGSLKVSINEEAEDGESSETLVIKEAENWERSEAAINKDTEAGSNGLFWKKFNCDSNPWMGCLKIVDIKSLKGYEQVLEIAAFFLLNANVLDVLYIKTEKPCNQDVKVEMEKRLASFPIASSHAMIAYSNS
ncbi:hypothetical protein AMTRI_Chr11g96470 [Amborella trichopoda]|uniref:F-box domain-containing protein n=1 Tax=Amborella trichopoda TaxID=13333 RepID=U5D2W1_AMBTC|nr:F-box/FBD/LRR-repeat protein At2g26030 [Amborella trichopoda]ERN16550.1 hypothetical protein AMTR_s00031p00154540 [Amborella trichopoda]|eukprot:XP_006855083.1 F-box/FBD/LRR-repeat protein At2g26030 [Amborella trichopoda]